MEPIVGEIVSLIGGRYELVKHLYTSSMSSVFKAWGYSQDCYVIFKIATNNSKFSNLVDYLKREASALERVDNPHVVRLLDSGFIEESYAIVLEYIHGKDLGWFIKRRYILPLDTSISIGVDILDGLKAMHQAGLVHRDLKPENLIAARIGVKIIDFGLVRFVSAVDRQMKELSSPGIVVGTPPYLSPEQATGLRDLDGRCDLYACGVVLYILLTGDFPFPKFVTGRGLNAYWRQPLRPFSQVFPPVNIPDNVQAIVWKALQVNPSLRYQTAEEMRMALLAVLGRYSKIIVP